jgi:hypothetical protein
MYTCRQLQALFLLVGCIHMNRCMRMSNCRGQFEATVWNGWRKFWKPLDSISVFSELDSPWIWRTELCNPVRPVTYICCLFFYCARTTYFQCAWFESRLGHRLSSLIYHVVFLSPFWKMLGVVSWLPFTVAERSKSRIVFARSEAGIVGFESHSGYECLVFVCARACALFFFVYRYRPCDELITRPRSPTDCLTSRKQKRDGEFHGGRPRPRLGL